MNLRLNIIVSNIIIMLANVGPVVPTNEREAHLIDEKEHEEQSEETHLIEDKKDEKQLKVR